MDKTTIKIELIHDVVCSWCPIGYRNIKAALKKFDNQLDVEFRFLPYELNPKMPKEGELIDNLLKRRNNWNSEELLRYRKNLIETSTQAGLTYDFNKRTHYWNTAKAHTLIHLAEKVGKHEEVNEILIQQYFAEGVNVDDIDILASVATSVGLNQQEALAAFSSPKLVAEIAEKQARVRSFKIRSVPGFVINDREILSGSNTAEFFVQYLSDFLTKTVV